MVTKSSTATGDDDLNRGRPRDPSRDGVILDAAAKVLTEVGYDRLSMEAVAAQAGVGKTTIYRRWPNKAAVVAALVAARAVAAPPISAPTDLRQALRHTVERFADQMARQDAGLLTAVFAARRSDPVLAAALHPVIEQDRATLSAPLRAAAEHSGAVLAPDFAQVLAELLPAVLLHRLLVTGQPADQQFVEHLVDRILLPLLTSTRQTQRCDAPDPPGVSLRENNSRI